MVEDFTNLEKRTGLSFKDKSLYEIAFIHRSYLNENKKYMVHNERLEFLGDAVLELIVTEYLYINFEQSEGELTNLRSALVKRETLAQVAREIDLGMYIKLSKGESSSGGRDKDYILANTVESLIGAIYLDSGYNTAREFIINHILIKLDVIVEKGLHIDSKSSFQEESQSIMGVTPDYRILLEEGPDHDKTFTVGLYIGDVFVSKGMGSSKQIAEQDAAKKGLIEKSWGKYRKNNK